MSHFMPAHESESNARVGICIPCDLADALVGATSCNCPKALTLLVRLGAMHAARMHAADAEKSPSHWTTEDWDQHFREEEELFFPLLPEPVVAQLLEEHNQFRMEMGIYGTIKAESLLGQHFHAEEQWAEYLLQTMPEMSETEITVSVSGTETAAPDTGKVAAVLAIGFGIAMLIMRALKAR